MFNKLSPGHSKRIVRVAYFMFRRGAAAASRAAPNDHFTRFKNNGTAIIKIKRLEKCSWANSCRAQGGFAGDVVEK